MGQHPAPFGGSALRASIRFLFFKYLVGSSSKYLTATAVVVSEHTSAIRAEMCSRSAYGGSSHTLIWNTLSMEERSIHLDGVRGG